MTTDEHGYPTDYDPLFAALVSASGWAKSRGARDVQVVLDTLLEHYNEGRTGELAGLVEERRKPLDATAPT